MENNTITPNPAPQPQPAAAMPTFGATPTTSATPVAQPTMPETAEPVAAANQPVATPAEPVVTEPAPAAVTAMAAEPAINPAPILAQNPAPAPETPVEATTVNAEAPAQNPINKGRLIALIAIIASLLVAGIIAAVIISSVVSRKDPSAIAKNALTNLTEPGKMPNNISGGLVFNMNDDMELALAFNLDANNLYFNYTGVSELVDAYIGLEQLANNENLASLSALAGLVEFAEDEWWQIPTEDFSLADAYRAHPFLTIAEANENGYSVTIDTDKFMDFLGGYADIADNSLGSFEGMLPELPDEEDLKQMIAELPKIKAEIDDNERFTSFYFVTGEEMPVSVNLRFNYAGSSTSPEEYRPIDELFTEFLKTIGY